MPVVRFADNQIVIAKNGDVMTLITDPQAMGGNDYVQIVWNLHALTADGDRIATLALSVQASNDGQMFYSTTLTSSQTSTANSPVSVGGFVRAAFIRLKYELTVGQGTNGASGYAAFDVHANIMKSGS